MDLNVFGVCVRILRETGVASAINDDVGKVAGGLQVYE